MFNVKSRKLVLTLFGSLALVLVLTGGASANIQLDGHRMLRKRQLLDPTSSGSPASSVPRSSTSPLPSTSSSQPTPSLTQRSSSSLSSSSLSSSSSPSSSSSSSQSTSSTPTPTPTPSDPPPPADTPSLTPATTFAQGQKTEVRTVTSSDASPTSSVPTTSGASSTAKTTVTVIVALAASIGAIVIIWTLIRKWKFKPSDKFEDRMQPIDWQPTGPTGPEESVPGGVPGVHRAASTHSHSSFYSGGHDSDHNSSQHKGNSIRRGVSPIPEHDFTAGPSHLAPGAGYADLARGPSPQPQMAQMHEAQHGVPLHHQGAYDSYGTVNGQRY